MSFEIREKTCSAGGWEADEGSWTVHFMIRIVPYAEQL